MDFIIEFLKNNPIFIVLGIIGSLASVIGIPLSIYQSSKRRKKIMFQVDDNVLIRNYKSHIKKLNIYYDNKEIESLNILKIYFWNAGKTIINKSDIYKEKPIIFSIESNCDILSADIVFETDITCKFDIKIIGNNKISIDFEDIESNFGAIFQVFYTGKIKSNIKSNVKVTGKIKDNGSIYEYNPKIKKVSGFIINISLLIIYILGSFFIIFRNASLNLTEDIFVHIANINDIQRSDITNIINKYFYSFDSSSIITIILSSVLLFALMMLVNYITNKDYKRMQLALGKIDNSKILKLKTLFSKKE